MTTNLFGFGLSKTKDSEVNGFEIWFRLWRFMLYWGVDYEKETGRHQLEEMGFDLNQVEVE